VRHAKNGLSVAKIGLQNNKEQVAKCPMETGFMFLLFYMVTSVFGWFVLPAEGAWRNYTDI